MLHKQAGRQVAPQPAGKGRSPAHPVPLKLPHHQLREAGDHVQHLSWELAGDQVHDSQAPHDAALAGHQGGATVEADVGRPLHKLVVLEPGRGGRRGGDGGGKYGGHIWEKGRGQHAWVAANPFHRHGPSCADRRSCKQGHGGAATLCYGMAGLQVLTVHLPGCPPPPAASKEHSGLFSYRPVMMSAKQALLHSVHGAKHVTEKGAKLAHHHCRAPQP